MVKNIVLAVLSVVNFALSAFCGFAFVAFSSRMIVKMGAEPYTTDMAGSGTQGGVYRYGFCIGIALFLQLVLFVLNLSVLPFVERDMGRVKQWRRFGILRRGDNTCRFSHQNRHEYLIG